jgi:hypothetical protein
MGAVTPGRIPWMAVVAWADFHDLPREELDLLDQCVVAMDSEFIAYHNAIAAEKPIPWHNQPED